MKFPKRSIENSTEGKIIYHAILIGISPLIPIIFVDEMIVGFFWRRMVSELAKSHNIQLSKTQISQLASHNGLGCSVGCSSILTYPIKEFIREILFWLEFRRGLDLATSAYYSGYLLNDLFQMESFNPAHSSKYSRAMTHATQRINRNMVKRVFISGIDTSKEKVSDIRTQVRYLRKKIIRKRGKNRQPVVTHLRNIFIKPAKSLDEKIVMDEDINQEYQKGEMKFKPSLYDIGEGIKEGLSRLPVDHLDHLRERFYEGVKNEGID